VEIVHHEQNLDFASGLDQSGDSGFKVFVILFGKLAARFDFQQFSFRVLLTPPAKVVSAHRDCLSQPLHHNRGKGHRLSLAANRSRRLN
jgi:hypothetical protein